MNYVIITENDESQWDDKTGISYHYPNKYVNKLTAGTKAIYYKGRITNEKFAKSRFAKGAHYFGVVIIGNKTDVNPEETNKLKKQWNCDILKFQPFDKAVLAKHGDEFIEQVPESRKANYWRDGVREIDKETYDRILALAEIDFDEEVSIDQYQISTRRFDHVFSNFQEFIGSISNGQSFIGFSEGFAHEQEAYKTEVREQSLKILKTSEWTIELVGKGEIAKRVVATFDLENNNLVGTRRKFGPDAVPHKMVLKAIETGEHLREIEQAIYDLFKDKRAYELIFDELKSFIGKQYSILAFLFFLRNDRTYLPISTTNFQFAFKELGCEIILVKQCSWTNYTSYLSLIGQVKDALEAKMDQPLNLLDAHSFLWLIGYKDRYRDWMNSKDQADVIIQYNAFDVDPTNNGQNQRKSVPTEASRDGDVDWDKKDKQKRIKGRRAEEHVIEYEKQRLEGEGRKDLAEKVEDYSRRYGAGFDVLSWNLNESPRKIEVKASGSNGFIITRNEVLKSHKNDHYWIYIVNEAKSPVEIKRIKAPDFKDQSKFRLIPKAFYVSFSIEE